LPTKNGQECATLDQAGSAHGLVFMQMLGQDRIFDRPEQGGMQPHGKQAEQQQRHRLRPEAHHRHAHDGHFGPLDPADQAGLVDGVGDLTCQCGKEEIGQDEQTGRHCRKHLGFFGLGHIEPEVCQKQHGEFEQVVVKCAKELHQEDRPEAAFPKKG
jgi:hypothetical protein